MSEVAQPPDRPFSITVVSGLVFATATLWLCNSVKPGMTQVDILFYCMKPPAHAIAFPMWLWIGTPVGYLASWALWGMKKYALTMYFIWIVCDLLVLRNIGLVYAIWPVVLAYFVVKNREEMNKG
ncbi:MAG TPA: hypothetical protein V6C81_10620 [Planktothrix sp.]|jgi:hypothetical protein